MTYQVTSSLDTDLLAAGVKFLPWVGTDYDRGRDGVRLLVVGESHYGAAEDAKSQLTRDVIEQFSAGTSRMRFATNVQTLLCERVLDPQQREEFWQSIAFYNYVQGLAGPGPRRRPTREAWTASDAAFRAVLAGLAPQALLVLGYETWGHFKRCWPEGPDLPDRSDLDSSPGLICSAGTVEALAFHTMHPSAGISPPQWFDRVRGGLIAAASFGT